MIPKKIHYFWFGRNKKTKLVQKCITSWGKFCPEYEIIEWNEDNFDVGMNAYTRMCYEQKKYAFLTDYLRLLVVEEYGGIYFDTDVEVVRSLDELLENKAFFGFETDEYINTGEGFGAEAHNSIIQQMLREYAPLLDGQHGTIGCPRLNTAALLKFGLVQNGEMQKFDSGTVYPAEYFNPYDDPTGILTRTKNTFSIHWYGKSWMDKKTVFRSKITRYLHRMFGTELWRKSK